MFLWGAKVGASIQNGRKTLERVAGQDTSERSAAEGRFLRR
ncbi:hypothetical protein BCO26_2711 [Heyndrickxia coagulans 2-6]|nr:hypothetical protein BCO26_2711 [Heyndrickxia coagulans 2-6]